MHTHIFNARWLEYAEWCAERYASGLEKHLWKMESQMASGSSENGVEKRCFEGLKSGLFLLLSL